jgi:hypothetical protein
LDTLTRQSNDEAAAAPAGRDARRAGEPLPARHLIGKFELRDTVHTSPAGIVYRAWDRDLGMAVAVKEHWPAALARRLPNGDLVPTSPSHEAAYADSLRGFVRISRALAHCDHPSLVRVLQLQFAHGTAYRVMPWIDGEPLSTVGRRQARPPDENALRTSLDALLGALEALHVAGSPHGGVAPQRILVERDGRPVLLAPPTPPSGETDIKPWTDLRDLAAVLRFWMQGPSEAPSRQVIEPSAAVMQSLALHDRQRHYGIAFLRVIDQAATSEGALRLRSVAAFRDQLREARRLDGHPTAVDPVLAQARVAATAPVAPVAPVALFAPIAPVARRGPIAAAPPAAPAAPVASAAPAEPVAPFVQLAPAPAAAEREPTPPEPTPSLAAPDPLLLGALDRDEMPEWLRQPRAPARRRGLPTAIAAVVLLGALGLGVGLGLHEPAPSIDPGVARSVTPPPAPAAQAPVTAPAPLPPAPETPTTPATATTPTTPTTPATAAADAAPTAAGPASAAVATATPPETNATATAAPPPAPPPAAAPAATVALPPAAPTPKSAGTRPRRAAASNESRPVRRSAAAAPAAAPATAAATSPREICGARTQFSLYWCMTQQCERAAWARHPQCVRFKRTDQVD